MLDVGMSAKLFLRAEDTVSMCYGIFCDFFSFEVCAIEAKPFQFLSKSVVKEGLT